MFTIFDQRNVFTSMGYVRDRGPVIQTTIHDRKLFKYGGIWYEAMPTFSTRTSYTQPPQNNNFPSQNSSSTVWHRLVQQAHLNYKDQQKQEKLAAGSEEHERVQREAETIAQSDALWNELNNGTEGHVDEEFNTEGCVYEEEEEPDFWKFMKRLGKETDDAIQLIMEQEENYFVARFDFH
ncbi:uncharacterized protein LOC132757254 [Ruditapes philippinarum]|uniref:uncharacterized protein LOC132757254 n=1 Tax=Ruditapes philippinarum TaxID=129788 RepID=UPI00295C36B8|nr:uncharacterized protein LOC132757254 [Ruditapes philippinarum]